MEAYTGRQHVSAAFKKAFTDKEISIDRSPAYTIMGQCNAQLIGASIKDFLLDPKVFVKAQVAAYERYKPDISSCREICLWNHMPWEMNISFPKTACSFPPNLPLKIRGN